MTQTADGKILKSFQRQGIDFLLSHPHALLADEMGLGKTIQAIAAAKEANVRKALVVCPASVRLNWHKEIKEWGAAEAGQEWEIISYNAAHTHPRRGGKKWDLLILDEAHYLKTAESQRTRAIFDNERGLARRCARKWCLTGTPVLNRPRELYPILSTLATPWAMPEMSFAKYAQMYCGAYFDGRGLNTRGASRVDELASYLSKFMLRRTKEEVAPELGSKTISRVPITIAAGEMEKVLAAEEEILNREALLSPSQEEYSQLGDLAKMRRILGLAKSYAVSLFVKDMLETVDKVVVFAWHHDVIAAIRHHLSDYSPVVHHGGMGDMAKQEAIDAFRTDPNVEVFIGQIISAGQGINGLQEVCSHAVFAEVDWVPGNMGQCLDRLHRFGRDLSVPVTGYIPYVEGTLENAMLGVVDGKRKVIDRLVDPIPTVFADPLLDGLL